MIDGGSVIAALRATDERSGGRREAWGEGWAGEREHLNARARELGGERLIVERDAFANTWYVLPGQTAETVLVHSHSDCVPGGGWLDGILGVHAGLGVLAAVAADEPPPRTLAVVDWADEEGTRFGRSLLGSAAATGALRAVELAALTTREGTAAADLVAAHGFDPAALGTCSPRLSDVVAAVELHIEQGPTLERAGRAVAAAAGCLGVRRRRIAFTGSAGHAGTIAMDERRDPARAAAEFLAAIMDTAERRGGLATAGEVATEPAVITAVPAVCRVSLDVRHAEREGLEFLDARTISLLDESRCVTEWTEVYRADPVDFDPGLVSSAARAAGGGEVLRSGALHDSASLARAGVPTAMLFTSSIAGVSHARAEDTPEADLRAALDALGALVGELLVPDAR
jgi:hydantoinase/carbamoylase family amidase